MVDKSLKYLNEVRSMVAIQVRRLRVERHWTQKELAEKIGLSQARLSEVERGAGSFTAEQLLLIVQLFNVPINQFVPKRRTESSMHAELQNALARLGAPHLQESEDALPSEQLEQVTHVVKEVLLIGSPRLLVALAPVLIKQIDQIPLAPLWAELRGLGREKRLYWLAENVVEAIQSQRGTSVSRQLASQYRRAETVLQSWLEYTGFQALENSPASEDLLDTNIRSAKTLNLVRANRSEISKRWGIVSELQPSQFAEALEAAHAGS